MEVSVLTIAFQPGRQNFPQEELEDFCRNKHILEVEKHFFVHEGLPYWTVMVKFERAVDAPPPQSRLSETEKLLFMHLKAWRKKKAETEGIPAYLVATNKQFVRMIQKGIRSQQALTGIKGFGRKRLQKYGSEIVNLFKKFYEDEHQS